MLARSTICAVTQVARVAPRVMPMALARRVHSYSTKAWTQELLDDELRHRIARHNAVVETIRLRDRWMTGSVSSISLGVWCGSMGAANPMAFLGAVVFVSFGMLGAFMGTMFLDKPDSFRLIAPHLSRQGIIPPPPMVVRIAHELEGELALSALLYFVSMHPDPAHYHTFPMNWDDWSSVARFWRAAKTGGAGVTTVNVPALQKREEE